MNGIENEKQDKRGKEKNIEKPFDTIVKFKRLQKQHQNNMTSLNIINRTANIKQDCSAIVKNKKDSINRSFNQFNIIIQKLIIKQQQIHFILHNHNNSQNNKAKFKILIDKCNE